MPIPKIVHYTWKTADLPRDVARRVRRWKALNPGWEFRFHDDAAVRRLVAEHYPEHLETFDSYPWPSQRIDVWRYFVLHHIGGVYADLDIEMKRSLNELLDQTDCFVVAEPEQHLAAMSIRRTGLPFLMCNAFMGSVPGHPFWMEIIQRLSASRRGDVLVSTGPLLLVGAMLKAPPAHRADVLSPGYWSPTGKHGHRWPDTPGYIGALEQHFRVIGVGKPPVAAHLWYHYWVGTKRTSTRLKINKVMRRLRAPIWMRLGEESPAQKRFTLPPKDYTRPAFIEPAEWPTVVVSVPIRPGDDTLAIAEVIDGLDYPRHLLSAAAAPIAGGEAEARAIAHELTARAVPAVLVGGADDENGAINALLDSAAGRDADVLLLGANVRDVPQDALRRLIGTGRDIVSANVGTASDPRDPNAYSMVIYPNWIDDLRILFSRGRLAPRTPGRRIFLADVSATPIAPIDSAGAGFLYTRRAAIAAGVRVPSGWFKLERGIGGMILRARDLGFETAGVPSLQVTRLPD